jgi:hypothetical protein
MKKVLFLLITFSVYSSIAQKEYNKEAWLKFSTLSENGLMKDASVHLEGMLNASIRAQDALETHIVLSNYIETFRNSNYEVDDRWQKLSRISFLADSVSAPTRNVLHFWLYSQINFNQYFWGIRSWEAFSFKGYKNGKELEINQDNLDEWIAYHRQQTLENNFTLQEIVLPTEHTHFKLDNPRILKTLYDRILLKMLSEYDKGSSATDQNWFGNSEQFLKSSSTEKLKLYQALELFNWNKNELDTYTFWVLKRIDYVIQLSKDDPNLTKETLLKTYETLYTRLNGHSSSLGVLLRIVDRKMQDKGEYHYKNNPSQVALNEEIHAALTKGLSDFKNSMYELQARAQLASLEGTSIQFSLLSDAIPNRGNVLNVNYANVSNVILSIYHIENQEAVGDSYFTKLDRKLVHEQALTLDQLGKYNSHSKQFLIPPFKEKGSFLYIIAANEAERDSLLSCVTYDCRNNRKAAYAYVFQTQLKVLTNEKNGKIEFLVKDIVTGKPISGANVLVTSNQNTPFKAEGKTDKNGYFVVKALESIKYTVSYKGDRVNSSQYTYIDDFRPEKQRYEIITDRAIYRPGQTVYFKVLAYEGEKNEFKVMPKHEVEVYLEDDNYTEFASVEGVTNEYGSFSGSFQLPLSGFLLGSMRLVVNDEKEKYIRVEEYKRPTFEVTAKFDKENYALNDLVTVSGTVKAFAGYGISDAKVNVQVQANRMWRYYGNAQTVLDTIIESNSLGEFTFNFLAKNLDQDAYGYNFTVTLAATSPSGESQTTTESKFIGKQAPEWNSIVPSEVFCDQETVAYLKLSDEEDRSTPISIQVSRITDLFDPRAILIQDAEFKGFKLDEMRKFIPNSIHDSEQKARENRKFVLDAKLLSGDSLALQKLVNNAPGKYELKTILVTEKNDTLSEIHSFVVIHPRKKKNQHQEKLWLATEKPMAEVGEEVTLILGSEFKSLAAMLEMYQGDSLLSREFITLKGRTTRTFTIRKENMGGLVFKLIAFIDNELYAVEQYITVPFTEKQVEVKLMTKRDFLLPGSKEKWSLQLKDSKAQPVLAELLASMYDASLDGFVDNSWYISPYENNYTEMYWQKGNEYRPYFSTLSGWYSYYNRGMEMYHFEQSGNSGIKGMLPYEGLEEVSVMAEGVRLNYLVASKVAMSDEGEKSQEYTVSTKNGNATTPAKPRKNFQETAFFYPQVYADKEGTYSVEFTLPDALTAWKFQAFAHDKNMRIGSTEHSVVAQKELMITPNAPRFFRAGDEFVFRATVVNISKTSQEVSTHLEWFNPFTNEVLTNVFGEMKDQKLTLAAGESKTLSWTLKIPRSGTELIAYRIAAESASFSDVEERMIPVLSNRTQLIESLPLTVEGKGEYAFELKNLAQMKSSTLEHKKLVLDYQANPIWSAVLALPYMTEYPYDCAEQVFSKLFATRIATYIVGQHPQIETVFNAWKLKGSDAFLSELSKNEELKNILLSETPWLMEATSEEEQRKKIALLFDAANRNSQTVAFFNKLEQMQNADGGWSWFAGGTSNSYITEYILLGFAHLEELDLIDHEDERWKFMISRASIFVSQKLTADFEKLTPEQRKKEQCSSASVHTMYALVSTMEEGQIQKNVLDYYMNGIQKNWLSYPLYSQALSGLTFLKLENETMAEKIKASLQNRSTKRKGLGMYWVENKGGYYWDQNSIETQAMILTFFNEMEVPSSELQAMKLWLLNQKRGQYWESTKTTALACYALLSSSTALAHSGKLPEIKLGNQAVSFVKTDEAMGQYQQQWKSGEINPSMAKVTVNQQQEEVNFGSLTWIYTEEEEKIPASTTGLTIQKKVYVVSNGVEKEVVNGQKLHLGDKLHVKLIFQTDRNLEYVHIKDLRASGTEPTQALSGYQYASGLYYYQTTRDASTEFFLDYLPKGNHLVEYELVVSASGIQSMGYAMIECLYAPTFRANSSSVTLGVE